MKVQLQSHSPSSSPHRRPTTYLHGATPYVKTLLLSSRPCGNLQKTLQHVICCRHSPYAKWLGRSTFTQDAGNCRYYYYYYPVVGSSTILLELRYSGNWSCQPVSPLKVPHLRSRSRQRWHQQERVQLLGWRGRILHPRHCFHRQWLRRHWPPHCEPRPPPQSRHWTIASLPLQTWQLVCFKKLIRLQTCQLVCFKKLIRSCTGRKMWSPTLLSLLEPRLQ